jgi:hypothetical protein
VVKPWVAGHAGVIVHPRGRERSDLSFDTLTLVEAVLVQVRGWMARTFFLDGKGALGRPRARTRVFSF